MPAPRLTPEKWLSAGFDALARLGPKAIAAEPLARALGTTKGSFYWHFKDVPAFQDALLGAWKAQALAHLDRSRNLHIPADQQLRQFGNDILQDSSERSLRNWGQSDPRVAQVLQDIDDTRRAYLVTLLGQLGLGNPVFATAIQATLVGLPQVATDGNVPSIAPFETLIDMVLALAEAE